MYSESESNRFNLVAQNKSGMDGPHTGKKMDSEVLST